MLKVVYSSKFKKDYKLIKKRGYNISKFEKLLAMLTNEEKLPQNYLDHALTGDFIGFRECHIEPDWLLIYEIRNNVLVLMLYRLGTHSELLRV